MALTNVTTRSPQTTQAPDASFASSLGECVPLWEPPTGVRAVAVAGRAATSSVLIAGLVKVSFGAGTVDLPGWIDTDLTWQAEFCLDVNRPWPVPSGCVDSIDADQVIEHFPLDVGRAVLRHSYDALTPGGSIRLATPDVERNARMYLEHSALCETHLDRHRSRGYPAKHPVDVLRVTFSENGHCFCYDFKALAAELQRAGFVDVRRHEAGESDDPAFQGLESRVDPTEVATTLTLEARKPRRSSTDRLSS